MIKSYTEYFGFDENPFKYEPDSSFYFPSKTHQDALKTLSYLLVSDDEDFALLMGSSGSGKSIVLYKLMLALSPDYTCVLIRFPHLSPYDFIRTVLENLEIMPDEELPQNLLIKHLMEYLHEQKRLGKKMLLIVDDAHKLPEETFEKIESLVQPASGRTELFKTILAGDFELDLRIKAGLTDNLAKRFNLAAKIDNLQPKEIGDYIQHRIDVAGGKKKTIHIASGIARYIGFFTKGNPRLINVLMERVLITTSIDEDKSIRKEHVNTAVRSMNKILPAIPERGAFIKGALTATVVLLIFTGATFAYKNYIHKPDEPTVVAYNPPDPEPITPEPTAEPDPVVEPIPDPVEPTPTPVVEPIPDPVIEPVPDPVIVPVVMPDPAPVVITNTLPTFGVGSTVRVNTGSLNVRGQARIDSERVGVVYNNQLYAVQEETNWWVRIIMPDGQPGWVFKTYILAAPGEAPDVF